MSALSIPQNLPQPVESLIDRMGGRQRAGILAVGIVSVLLILGLAHWASQPEWTIAVSGPLETVGAVTQQLDEAGIPYRLENGGSQVLVPAPELPRARVLLAGQGLPAAGRPGLELFDQPSWGMTDFTQRINYRRALEGELERTIGKMRGVESAQVHLSMQETSSFRRADRPAEASVVLQLRGGASPGADVVQGIAHLVASSVDALDSERVTVLDESGRLLSSPDEPGSLAGLSSRQLETQREIESYLEGKAEALLAQMVGTENVRVQVSADVSFDRVERTVESVDPDRQATASEQRSEIIPGAEGGAGSTSSATTYETSRSLETFSGATGAVKRLTVAVLVNERIAGAAAEGEEAPTVEPRSEAELARIETLVRSAVGFDPNRGDVVSVVSVPFDGAAVPVAEEGIDVWGIVETTQRPALTGLALLLAFFVAMRVLKTLRPTSSTPVGAGVAPALTVGQAPEEREAIQPPPPMFKLESTNNVVRGQVISSVEQHPEVATRLVRSWLKES